MVKKICYKGVSTEKKKIFNGKEIRSFKNVVTLQR